MSVVKEIFALLQYNTFQVPANARYFIELNDAEEVKEFLDSGQVRKKGHFVLGGGSNVLFTKDFDGIILHPVIKGVEVVREDAEMVILKAGAGENWDDFVEYCVKRNLGGIENLSLIPGMVGASPVQNIGAYGMEVKDAIDSVEGYLIDNAKQIRFSAKECHFSYRDSIFKNELKDKVIITRVNFKLWKNPQYVLNYPDLEKELNNYDEVNLTSIRQAIIDIRTNKLPDPAITGNAGSFFKNPVINKGQAESLRKFFPGMPGHVCRDGSIKLSAAWLIEQSGWKGRTFGKVATHKKQPLIIINRGGASGSEILQCAQKIQKSVMNHFAIRLEMEVNIL